MKHFIILIGCLALATTVFGQSKTSNTPVVQRAEKWSIAASISETKNIPLFKATGIDNSITKVYHPKYTIGAERSWKIKNGTRKYLGAELSYHNNYLVDRAISLNLNVAVEYNIYNRVYVGFGMGLGFAKAKRADLVYELKDGVWEPMTYPGKWQYNRYLLRGNAELGYRFNRYPADVFLGSNIEAQLKYLGADIPLNLSQTPFRIGARWHLQSVK
jgi:hypothetical protein